MRSYTIKLNGLYIQGLSDEIEDIPVGYNNGFHSYDKGGLETILFTPNKNDAIKIIGIRNMNSWFKKIYDRGIDFKILIIEEI